MCKDAGYGVSIFDKVRQIFPKAVLMLVEPSIHPLISEFPSDYFYKGKLKNGSNGISSEHHKKFRPMNLPVYRFMDVPLKEMTSSASWANLSSIFILLQTLCEGIVSCYLR